MVPVPNPSDCVTHRKEIHASRTRPTRYILQSFHKASHDSGSLTLQMKPTIAIKIPKHRYQNAMYDTAETPSSNDIQHPWSKSNVRLTGKTGMKERSRAVRRPKFQASHSMPPAQGGLRLTVDAACRMEMILSAAGDKTVRPDVYREISRLGQWCRWQSYRQSNFFPLLPTDSL